MFRHRAHTSAALVGAATLAVLFGSAVAIAGPKVKVDQKPGFDFVPLKTWAWNSSGAGGVKVWLTKDSKSEPVQRQYEPAIMQAVEDELGRKGYVKATSGAPDFQVTYYVLITAGSSSQYAGQFLPTALQWGMPLISPQATSLTVY